MDNLADILVQCAPHFADHPVLVFKDEPVAFHGFTEQVARLATGLIDKGVVPGTRVVLLAYNRPEWLVSFFAILQAGGTVVPVNPGLAAREVQGIVEHCEPVLAIVQEELTSLLGAAPVQSCVLGGDGSRWHQLVQLSEPLSQRADTDPDQTALIFYTSGTTGKPKGVMLSHRAMLFDVTMFSGHLRIGPNDRSLVVGSMAFMLHLILNALSNITAGSTVVLLDRFHPAVALKTAEKYRITLLMAVPTVYVMMMNWLDQGEDSVDLSSVRWALTSGAAFPSALYDRACERFGFPVFDLWGMTECAPVTAYDVSIDRTARRDSCGRVLPGCGIRVVDTEFRDLPPGEVGEVLLRSPAMMSGYFRNAPATEETIVDGWVYSGDLGRIDADGFLYIIGRRKDMIIRGGSNIYPAEIEDVMYLHNAVGECAAVGVPDSTFGETVMAFVVVKEGHILSQEEVISHCKLHLAEYKVPARVELVETLPKGPTGKILRRELRLLVC
ncbi:class I adenylate-forming enzyme family protein [Burkholderia cepacia]|uniref:class I adenylate-forming enzyme family protein n=1 Tax=Burkholderia cepacia TaxID=292 RepID=UPI001CF0EE4A|nr:AMP-binding protein [Burkholderia cepacia]MCA8057379.1 AMP-binding protein [Burkholderia cepacia]MDN7535204.1 AMP-binding protein [Burkholderia orbicola]